MPKKRSHYSTLLFCDWFTKPWPLGVTMARFKRYVKAFLCKHWCTGYFVLFSQANGHASLYATNGQEMHSAHRHTGVMQLLLGCIDAPRSLIGYSCRESDQWYKLAWGGEWLFLEARAVEFPARIHKSAAITSATLRPGQPQPLALV